MSLGDALLGRLVQDGDMSRMFWNKSLYFEILRKLEFLWNKNKVVYA